MTPDRLFAAQEATWPPAAATRIGPWCIRDGQGGGKRVSAATAEGRVTEADIDAAETAMEGLGQPALFMVRPGDEALDALLAGRGYTVVDPVAVLAAPVARIAADPPPVTAFTVWEPLAIMDELWAENDIGPARRAVMARVNGPKTALLGRQNDRAAGAGFAAIHDGICFVHAMVVAPGHRRQGTAVNMMRAAAMWAQDQGATDLAVLVTEANGAARALYASLGLENVGQYHYRMKVPQMA
ncbi:GNAT family N-acetyltransferase [Rhodovulum euryhalinum]|uniref:Acetyltransferase (GNAT) family protein n=1 Tax=Rhodovulum euryhalinum TaxID=35805 RepID=A0A4V2SAZ1_9RHOB|nr:GNAT family N-acetyltransferase [Rhodovulum euryhalinum]TCO73510.1 acetyltransferase (GNAT) family protein [Rhodovulum euryhalinum]